MAVHLEVSVSDDLDPGEEELPASNQLQNWLDAACEQSGEVVVSLLIAGESEIRRLNRDYRDRDRPTNVLSFPMRSPEQVQPRLLGDIALCAPVIRAEATAQGKPLPAHWAHMLVHGMLHLQGYDHLQDEEAERMEQREIQILQQLGFDDPYLDSRS